MIHISLTFLLMLTLSLNNFIVWVMSLFFVVIMFIYYFLFLSFSLPFQGMMLSSFFYLDDMSIWLILVTLFVIFTSIMTHYFFYKLLPLYSPVMLLIFCLYMFMSSNLLFMYIMYEASLLPISYIIMKWGVYSDRSMSVLYMMLYTSLFSFPLMVVMVYWILNNNIYIYSLMNLCPFNVDFMLLILISLAFMVKFPVYGLHYWLPLAHVEAPTFGSMILAGILLKLGGYGLYRSYGILSYWNFNLSYYFMVYFMMMLLVSSIVTSQQLDFKRLIAYSSVVHMTGLMVVLLNPNLLFSSVYLMIMILHGLLSPVMFMLVGLVYNLEKTRNLFLLRGLFASSFLLVWLSSLIFLMNIPTPPFPQFYMEVLFFLSVMDYDFMLFGLVLVIYTFLSLVYNLSWYLPLSVYPPSPLSLNTTLGVAPFLVFFSYIMYLVVFFMVYV